MDLVPNLDVQSRMETSDVYAHKNFPNLVTDAREIATALGLDPEIFQSLIIHESGFNPNALGSAGEIGLGQIMPSNLRTLNINGYNPQENLLGSATLLAQALKKFGNYQDALSYYAGGSHYQSTEAQQNAVDVLSYAGVIKNYQKKTASGNALSTPISAGQPGGQSSNLSAPTFAGQSSGQPSIGDTNSFFTGIFKGAFIWIIGLVMVTIGLSALARGNQNINVTVPKG